MENKQNTGPGRSCARCGREYQSIRISKKYCSDSCKTIAWRDREEQRRRDYDEQRKRVTEDNIRLNKAIKEKMERDEKAKSEKMTAMLNELTEKTSELEEKLQARVTEIETNNELIKLTQMEHTHQMDLIQLKRQISNDEAERNRETARKRRRARSNQNYRPTPDLSNPPPVETNDAIPVIVDIIKAFIPGKG